MLPSAVELPLPPPLSLVGVRVVVVVLDAPGLKGEDERHEHDRAHDVLHQVVLVERAVPRVVAHDKPLEGREEGRGEYVREGPPVPIMSANAPMPSPNAPTAPPPAPPSSLNSPQ